MRVGKKPSQKGPTKANKYPTADLSACPLPAREPCRQEFPGNYQLPCYVCPKTGRCRNPLTSRSQDDRASHFLVLSHDGRCLECELRPGRHRSGERYPRLVGLRVCRGGSAVRASYCHRRIPWK